MKRNILSAALILIANTAIAQIVLWSGEDLELGSQGGCWDDGNPVVVENPAKDGINTSEKYTMMMTPKRFMYKVNFEEGYSECQDFIVGIDGHVFNRSVGNSDTTTYIGNLIRVMRVNVLCILTNRICRLSYEQ